MAQDFSAKCSITTKPKSSRQIDVQIFFAVILSPINDLDNTSRYITEESNCERLEGHYQSQSSVRTAGFIS